MSEIITPTFSRELVVLTGQSGAGLTSALKCMEDLDFESFDNMPLDQIAGVAKDSVSDEQDVRLAFAVDSRTRHFSAGALEALREELGAQGWEFHLLYLHADEAVLQKRFSETRRRHPMAGAAGVTEGIAAEKALLSPIARFADITIDTSTLNIHDLRARLEAELKSLTGKDAPFQISLMSFGFKNGAPREADIIMDVRFLANPHWDQDLREKTGQQEGIGDFIKKDPAFEPFIDKFSDLLAFLIPAYKAEGKKYLTVAFGCTGGRHRSVFVVEHLKDMLQKKGFSLRSTHRDL
ncbi:MAG: RNase adapter RapZ [Pseudobdellovibrionaceae bacterium]